MDGLIRYREMHPLIDAAALLSISLFYKKAMRQLHEGREFSEQNHIRGMLKVLQGGILYSL